MDYSKDERMLGTILNTIISSAAGLKYAIITDDTGITITSQSKFRVHNSDSDSLSVEKIGAIGGAVFTAGEEQGIILGYGEIGLQITEYETGVIFSIKAGKGILCLATDLNVQIGFIKAIVKKWAPRIGVILNRYLKMDQGIVNEELKQLFSTDSLEL